MSTRVINFFGVVMAVSGSSLEKTFEEYLVTKAPFQLPHNIKEAIVKFSPWITLVLLILLAPAILFVLGVGTAVGVVAPSFGIGIGLVYWIAFIMLIIQVLLMALSIPGLMRREIKGWTWVYYAELIAVVHAVLSWLSNPINIFGLVSALFSALIGFYILFQIRSFYH